MGPGSRPGRHRVCGELRRIMAARPRSAICARALLAHSPSSNRRAQGRPGAGRARGPPAQKMQAAGTTGSAEIARPSLRDGLHAYMQASWRSACWPPCATTRFTRCAVIPASRYQNPATSRPPEHRSSAHPGHAAKDMLRALAATAPRLACRDDRAQRPFRVRRDAREDRGDLPDDTSEITCDKVTRRANWPDGQMQIELTSQRLRPRP